MPFRAIVSLTLTLTLLLSALTLSTQAQETEIRDIQGTLARGDKTFEDGSLIDVYSFDVADNEAFKVRLQTTAFDSQLVIAAPGDGKFLNTGERQKDDDQPIDLGWKPAAGEGGKFQVIVAAHTPGQEGSYKLRILGDRGSAIFTTLSGPDDQPVAAAPPAAGDDAKPGAAAMPAQPGGGAPAPVGNALTFTNSNDEEIVLKLGNVAFVDESVDGDFGDQAPKEASRDRDLALGRPDYDPKKKEEGYYTLGKNGSAVWQFKDNSLINGPGDDLLIFEIGEYREPIKVEISSDGNNWLLLGEIDGSTCSIDIGPKTQAGTEFFFVKLTDINGRSGQWPGADVDAIAAINGNIYLDAPLPGGGVPGAAAVTKPMPADQAAAVPGPAAAGAAKPSAAPMPASGSGAGAPARARIELGSLYCARSLPAGDFPEYLQIRVQENGSDGSMKAHQFPKGKDHRYYVEQGGALDAEPWPTRSISTRQSVDEGSRKPGIDTGVLADGEIKTYLIFAAHAVWPETGIDEVDRRAYALPVSNSWQPNQKTGNADWDLKLRNTIESRLARLEHGYGFTQANVAALALAVGNFNGKLECVCMGITFQDGTEKLFGKTLLYPTQLRNGEGRFEAKVTARSLAEGETANIQVLGSAPLMKRAGISSEPLQKWKDNIDASGSVAENYLTVTIQRVKP